MKNLNWKLIINTAVVINIIVGIYFAYYLWVSSTWQGEGDWGLGGAVIIILWLPLLCVLGTLFVGIVAQERKGAHALLALLSHIIIAAFLLAIYFLLH